MVSWRAEAKRAIEASLAPGTRLSYSRYITEFDHFRVASQLGMLWPAPIEHLMQFAVSLWSRKLSVKTMKGYFSAVAFHSKAQGVADFTGDFRLRRMLEGWARQLPPVRDARRPFTPTHILIFLDKFTQLCVSFWEVQLFSVATLVAFFGAFRISELLVASRTDGRCRALAISDVALFDGRVVLTVRQSKTDQRCVGQRVHLYTCSDARLCPVQALSHWKSLLGDRKGPLFQHESGLPLTQYQFWAVLRKALRAAGLPERDYGTHSFRIGAASAAAELGFGSHELQRLGRWKSGAYKSYIRK